MIRRAPYRGGLISYRDLVHDLRDLGITAGATVLVHSSLRSVGRVLGGATTVVRALSDVVGLEGTIVVPTITPENSDPSRWHLTRKRAVPKRDWARIREQMPPFDPATTPARSMGAVAEAVRTWPGAVRSAHPQTSFAAIGARAAKLMGDHQWDCHYGERSPLARLAEVQAGVLLLGVGYEVCTAFHHAEYLTPRPAYRDYECVVRDDSGIRRWFRYRDVELRDEDFADLGAAYEASESGGSGIRVGAVGHATARLLPITDAVKFATGWLQRHRSNPDPDTNVCSSVAGEH